MKKIFILASFAVVIAACGSGDGKKEEVKTDEKTETKPADDLSSNPVYVKGLSLIGSSDCLTCHKIDEKLNGPSYRDVANKYGGMPDTIVAHLAGKIIKGGSGVWGQVLMTPHPSLSQADAEAMVNYILLLKK